MKPIAVQAASLHPLTVLNVAYPLAPVGPDAVGGAEQVLTQIDTALVRHGHRSIVIACEGSRIAGDLLCIPRADGELTEAVRARAQLLCNEKIREALQRYDVDLVHLHGVDCYQYIPLARVPVLITLHLPPAWYPAELFELNRPETYLQCVSRSQHLACPPSSLLVEDIPNGAAVDFDPPCQHKGRYVVMLGRICPEKGYHIGFDAAAQAGLPLVLAGKVYRYETHERYFCEEILPRVSSTRRYIGSVGLERKRRLLASARCLALPALAPETSSLVSMEALACGTPVVAFPVGALPEIIEDEKTGFLVKDQHEMAQAFREAARLKAEDCRRAARERFSLDRMLGAYLRLYDRLAAARESRLVR